jgi:hypothetical protein
LQCCYFLTLFFQQVNAISVRKQVQQYDQIKSAAILLMSQNSVIHDKTASTGPAIQKQSMGRQKVAHYHGKAPIKHHYFGCVIKQRSQDTAIELSRVC